MTDEKFEEFIEHLAYDGDVDRHGDICCSHASSPHTVALWHEILVTFRMESGLAYVIPMVLSTHREGRTVIPDPLRYSGFVAPLMETVITVFRELPNIPTGLNTL